MPSVGPTSRWTELGFGQATFIPSSQRLQNQTSLSGRRQSMFPHEQRSRPSLHSRSRSSVVLNGQPRPWQIGNRGSWCNASTGHTATHNGPPFSAAQSLQVIGSTTKTPRKESVLEIAPCGHASSHGPQPMQSLLM